MGGAEKTIAIPNVSERVLGVAAANVLPHVCSNSYSLNVNL